VFNHNLLDRYIYGVVSSKKFYNNSGYKINLKKVHFVFVVIINMTKCYVDQKLFYSKIELVFYQIIWYFVELINHFNTITKLKIIYIVSKGLKQQSTKYY
jgi:hypothetical protein